MAQGGLMREARVCHVITQLELGGAQENTLYTVSHLGAPFHASLVCGPGGMLDEEARRLGVPLRFVPSLQRSIRPLLDLRALRTLARIFREMRPDIVHTHSSKAGILGRLAARLAGVPRVIHTIHGYGFHAGQPAAVRRSLIAFERLAARVTDHFIAVSRANLEEGIRLRLFPRERATLIRSGIQLRRFGGAAVATGRVRDGADLRRVLGLSRDAPVVGMVACLKPQKSPLTFVEVAARVTRNVPDAVFVLVGDGILRHEVERRATELGLGRRLRLLGWRRDIPEIMAAFDVLLHTPLWEGLPRVLPEAIASGVPIVATRVDGVADILEDESTGLVRAPGDAEGLARAVERLLTDRALGHRLVGNARAVLPEFDIDAMVRAQEGLYHALLGDGGVRSPGCPLEGTNNDGGSGRIGDGSRAARTRVLATH